MKRSEITPEMRHLMSPEDAARYEEALAIHDQLLVGEPKIPKLERDEHATFENWLISHDYAYRHSRTDKRTREMAGPPDFTVYKKADYLVGRSCNLCVAIEFKLPGNKLSPAQQAWAARYGGVVHVLATADEAIKLVLREFGL